MTHNTLILSGGGMRCLSFIGAYKALLEKNEKNIDFNINEVCGVSGGAIFGLMIAIGMTVDKMQEIVIDTDFSKLKNIRIKNLFTNFGLDSGRRIIEWLRNILKNNGISPDITFIELSVLYNIKRLNILATNLSTFSITEFNYENTPNVKVIDAIRMSINIPIIFTKVIYNGDYHVDGAVIDNFPLDKYKNARISETSDASDIPVQNAIIGFKLSSGIHKSETIVDKKTDKNSIKTYISMIINCIISNKSIRNANDSHSDIVYDINAGNIYDTINFNMSKQRKIDIINSGYQSVKMT